MVRGNGRAPARARGGRIVSRGAARRRQRRSARVEIANVARQGIGRRITIRDAARLILELSDRSLVGLGGGGEAAEDGTAAPLTGDGRRHRSIVELLVTAREAYERQHPARPALVCHVAPFVMRLG